MNQGRRSGTFTKGKAVEMSAGHELLFLHRSHRVFQRDEAAEVEEPVAELLDARAFDRETNGRGSLLVQSYFPAAIMASRVCPKSIVVMRSVSVMVSGVIELLLLLKYANVRQ
jgi:hypothetical protein